MEKVKPTEHELGILETCLSVHQTLVRAWKFAPEGFSREVLADAIHELEDELDFWDTESENEDLHWFPV